MCQKILLIQPVSTTQSDTKNPWASAQSNLFSNLLHKSLFAPCFCIFFGRGLCLCCVPGGLAVEEVHSLLLSGLDCELHLPSALSTDTRSIAEPTESVSLVPKIAIENLLQLRHFESRSGIKEEGFKQKTQRLRNLFCPSTLPLLKQISRYSPEYPCCCKERILVVLGILTWHRIFGVLQMKAALPISFLGRHWLFGNPVYFAFSRYAGRPWGREGISSPLSCVVAEVNSQTQISLLIIARLFLNSGVKPCRLVVVW